MKKTLKLAVTALCLSLQAQAQTEVDTVALSMQDELTFTFTEAQLGGDDDVTDNITLISSNRNTYASQVGFRFSPVRFKYRAFGSKYNEVYINGNPVNDVERGEFNFSSIGGLNSLTNNAREAALPFEDNLFGMTSMGGSNNYNLRPSSFATGQRVSLSGANRNYTTRAYYTYNSGVTSKGWAFTGTVAYRWANMETAYVEGTFYNSLSYFLGAEKLLNDQHSLSLVTWGNPTERGAQASSTDEMYWIANNRFYNPNWGYQDGKKRNSRIVNSFTPTALLTWDWKIDDDTKLVTSLLGKYSMYSSTRLNYNNATNPSPDYYSIMPSSVYDVWAPYYGDRSDDAFSNWSQIYQYLSASKANRQINWDQLYYANKQASLQGADAVYYQQAYHDDQLAFSLSSTLRKQLARNKMVVGGLNLSANRGMHYQTMEDLLGATQFHNVNTYAIGTYSLTDDRVQYDMNNPNQVINNGDRFGYDYNILVNKANAWATYSIDNNRSHLFFSGRIGGTTMQRDGKMRNGLAPDNSYGKGKTAKFLDGGVKMGIQHELAPSNMVTLGVGYEMKAPQARNAFISPQVNNDFAYNLKNEKIFSAEVGYQLQTSWMKANLNTYLSRLTDVSEYSMAYSDTENSFTYISLTGIAKEYIGAELGIDFKVTNEFNIKMLGTVSDAQYTNNAKMRYMRSEDGLYNTQTKDYVVGDDVCMNQGMREGGTPLTAGSIDLAYHAHGWYLDLIGNYYDRIYLYYSPIVRYLGDQPKDDASPVGYDISRVPSQAKGHGGFMLDASIGKSIYTRKGQLSINLQLTNLLNNLSIVTGGMEQNRRDTNYNKGQEDQDASIRTYSFVDSPKKFYANGINGMLTITYRY